MRPSNEVLAERVRAGDRHAGAELLTSCGAVLRWACRRVRFITAMEVADLEQEAVVGLFRAAKEHTAARGSFSAFAATVVTNHLLGEAPVQGRLVRGTRHAARRAFADGGQRPAWLRPTMSLDAPATDDADGATLGDRLCDNAPSPDELVAQALLARKATQAMASLPERERRVMRQHFEEGQTLEEIGQELGVSREYVRQIKAQALRRMRQHLERGRHGR